MKQISKATFDEILAATEHVAKLAGVNPGACSVSLSGSGDTWHWYLSATVRVRYARGRRDYYTRCNGSGVTFADACSELEWSLKYHAQDRARAVGPA